MTGQSNSNWFFCQDRMPSDSDADPWGNLFVVFEDDLDREPELAPVQELLEMVEAHSGNGLPPKMHFHWTHTGLTQPPKRRSVN